MTTGPSKYTPGYLLQRNEGLCSHKNLYTEVCSSCIPDSPKPEVPQMPPSGDYLNTRWSIHTVEY